MCGKRRTLRIFLAYPCERIRASESVRANPCERIRASESVRANPCERMTMDLVCGGRTSASFFKFKFLAAFRMLCSNYENQRRKQTQAGVGWW